MTKKHIFGLIIPFILTGFLTGCGHSLESAYTFPEEVFAGNVDEAFKLDGFASGLCVPEDNADVNADDINAAAFALFDVEDAEIISQHNLYESVYPASTTKILTCLLALENGNLDDIVTVPEESDIDVSGSSMAGLKPGDEISLKDLLYALMVPSGNDAAVAIAHYVSGDVNSFAELMNERAKELGATRSHFVNPNGLPDDDHYTTVYDMYLIFNEALKNKDFIEIAGAAEYSCTVRNPSDYDNPVREVSWKSGNGFLNGRFEFADNMRVTCGKTGHTNAAGYCLVQGEADSDGREYISIIMNSEVYEEMYSSMRALAEKSRDAADPAT